MGGEPKVITDAQAVRELGEYGKTPEHLRDREAFRQEQLAKARQLLEMAAEASHYQWWTASRESSDQSFDLTA